MPVFIFHGDSFLVSESLAELRSHVGHHDVQEGNTHKFSGQSMTLDQIQATCNAIPFLAQNRLVVVEGLLGSFERRDTRGRAGRTTPANRLAKWEGLQSYLAEVPPTTLLTFVDDALRANNPMLTRLAPKAEVRKFNVPRGEELARWTRNRAEAKGAKITPGALRLLGQYVGGNLRVLDVEIEKLSLYATGEPINEGHVSRLVSQVREASIFAAVDAIVQGRPSVAMRLLRKLRNDGAGLSYLQAMIARQLRLVTLAKDLLERGVPTEEMGRRLELRADFAVRKTLDQARTFSWPRLKALYAHLLDMDLAIKQGRQDEDLALELLVAEAAVLR